MEDLKVCTTVQAALTMIATDGYFLVSCSFEAEGFDTECKCLQRNTECDANCACDSARCLNRSVGQRRPLRLGEDVAEIDSWGFDCYTRRNFFDGECGLVRASWIDSQACDNCLFRPDGILTLWRAPCGSGNGERGRGRRRQCQLAV
jgi:hypothetical protein